MYNNRVPSLSQEQQWSDEVHYLHSLWHQGPPSSSSSNPNPNNIPKPKPNNNLGPSSSTSFKKQNQETKNKRKRDKTENEEEEKEEEENSTPPPVLLPDVVEWPSEPVTVQRTKTGWPEPLYKLISPAPVSVEDQEKLAAVQLQQKSYKAVQEFFSRDDNDNDNEEEEEEEEDLMEEEGGEEEFFLRVFKEDNELMDYYERKYESGEFCCLVCGGSGEKVWKRFKNCVALVQHSVAIAKTRRKSAHRAFGNAVCKVLGWNINRLPGIVLSMDEPLRKNLGKEGSEENNSKVEDSILPTDNVGSDQNGNSQIAGSLDPEKGDQTECEKNNSKVEDSIFPTDSIASDQSGNGHTAGLLNPEKGDQTECELNNGKVEDFILTKEDGGSDQHGNSHKKVADSLDPGKGGFKERECQSPKQNL